MIVKNPNDYSFLRFEVSHLATKKYNSVLLNKKTNRELRVPFGSVGYQQYKDNTGLGVYSKYDHNDPKRRALYRKRHKGEELNKYSSGYWSWFFLW